MFEKLFPAWNLKANRCPAHCLVHKSFWSGHRHCCYGSSPAGSQLSSAAIQLATTHSRLRTRSRTGQKKTSSLYNEKSCSYLSKSFKTSRVLKYRIYSYQRLSFDLDWLYERKSLQFRFCKFFSCDIVTRHFESQLKITSQETTTNWCCCLCEQNAQNNMEIVRKYPFTCPWWFVYGDLFRPEVLPSL